MQYNSDEVALGIGRHLHPFALAVGASAYWNWNRDGLTTLPVQSLRTFGQAFQQAVGKAAPASTLTWMDCATHWPPPNAADYTASRPAT